MSSYIAPPIVADATEISAAAIDYLIESVPGFVPRDGNLEVWLITALSRIVAEAMTVASAVPKAIFRYFGRSLLGVLPVDAASAVVPSTWTMIDGAGYTIPGGTLVAFRTAGDVLVPFRVVAAVTVDPGDTTTGIGEVLLAALVPGSGRNGIPPGPLELIDALATVADVTSTAATSGGADAETDDAYLNRLAGELALLSPRPILPQDFSQLALRVPGVGAAVTIDGYDPVAATTGNERMVTVGIVGTDGAVVPTETKTAVDNLLQRSREVNFVVNTVDPDFTELTVTYTVRVRPGFVPDTVRTAVDAALASYLDPVTWAQSYWPNTETIVRRLTIGGIIARTAGVEAVIDLRINGSLGDIALGGAVPLPHLQTAAGTTL